MVFPHIIPSGGLELVVAAILDDGAIETVGDGSGSSAFIGDFAIKNICKKNRGNIRQSFFTKIN